jgi:hypothetical protein
LGALNEAQKALERDPNGVSDHIKRKETLLRQFIQAHQLGSEKEVEECEKICAILLNENDIDSIIKIGDIFGLLIESNYNYGDIEKSRELLKRLKVRIPPSMTVEYYVRPEICRALNPDEYQNNEIEEYLK